MRAPLLLSCLCVALTAGCPPPSAQPPAPAPWPPPPPPEPTPEPEPAEPNSLVLPDEAKDQEQAHFVRLRSIRVGGDFDNWGSEEVRVTLSLRGREVVLREFVASLESGKLRHVTLEEPEWIEVPVGANDVELVVVDVDVTEHELITETHEPVALDPAAFTDEELRVGIGLKAIEYKDQKLQAAPAGEGFFGLEVGETLETIEGPSAELGLLRVPRKDAADDHSRAVVKEALALLLGPEGETPAGLYMAHSLAKDRARAETHTHLRCVLHELSVEARALEELKKEVDKGLEGRDLRRGLQDLEREARSTLQKKDLPPAHRPLVEKLVALGGLHEEPPPWEPETLARIQAEGAPLKRQVQQVPKPTEGRDPFFFLRGSVERLPLDEVEQGKAKEAEFAGRLTALRMRVEAGD